MESCFVSIQAPVKIYFQLSDEEIAKAHGLTKENVRQIRCRAKKKLISSMKEGM